jgi:hypothetical protein
MSMILCPICGNECSADALSCPKCGHPFVQPEVDTVVAQPIVAPVAPERVVVRERRPKDNFPSWAIPLVIVLGILTLGLLYFMFSSGENDDANRASVNVRLRGNERETRTAAINSSASDTTTGTTTTTTTTVPQTAAPDTVGSVAPPAASRDLNSSSSTLPPYSSGSTPSSDSLSTTRSDKGNLGIKATVTGRAGSAQPVKQEKFYLLDEELATILTRANIEPEEGDVVTTCAAAVADQSRRETLQKCLAAIRPHIVYSVTTDARGEAKFKDVKPDSYYLFGFMKTADRTYAVWNTMVTVSPGENTLNLNGNSTSSPSYSNSTTGALDNSY